MGLGIRQFRIPALKIQVRDCNPYVLQKSPCTRDDDDDANVARAADILRTTMQVVGSQARILYSDCRGRVAIAVAFNAAVRDKTITVCFAHSYM